jgi:hypothetical protein
MTRVSIDPIGLRPYLANAIARTGFKAADLICERRRVHG